MTNGLPGDEVFYESLRRRMAEVITHSKMVGHYTDLYYGDLKVYQFQAPLHLLSDFRYSMHILR